MLLKKRMVIISATIGVLALGLAGAVGIPSALSIRNHVGKIAVEQGKIDERYALRRYVRNSIANLAETKRHLGSLSAVALKEGHELEFVTALERAANEAGVQQKLTLETVNQKDLSPWEREIPVRIEVDGEYPKVLAFLNAIERLPFVVIIEGIQIGTPRISSIGAREGVVDALVQGIVYWQGQGAPDFVHGRADEVPLSDDTEDSNMPL